MVQEFDGGKRVAAGVGVQAGGEALARWGAVVEQGGAQVVHLLDAQWRQVELGPEGAVREAGGQGGHRVVGGQFLGAVGEDQGELVGQARDEKVQQRAGVGVDPVDVLDDQHGRPQGGEDLPEGAEEPVALTVGVGQHGRRVGKQVGALGQQRVQGAADGVETGGDGRAAQGLDHGPVGKGGGGRVAVAQQRAGAGGVRVGVLVAA
ncbi:hypothetical protein NOGI109294_09725 [Nocardiopsis gilva]